MSRSSHESPLSDLYSSSHVFFSLGRSVKFLGSFTHPVRPSEIESIRFDTYHQRRLPQLVAVWYRRFCECISACVSRMSLERIGLAIYRGGTTQRKNPRKVAQDGRSDMVVRFSPLFNMGHRCSCELVLVSRMSRDAYCHCESQRCS